MADPQFPDVPSADGVPPVKRDGDNPGTDTQAPLSDDEIVVNGTEPNRWGIYTADNAKALDPDTVMTVSYQAEYRIADFPIEEGSFESYDKVELPFDIAVRMTKGGTREDRRAFLSAVEDIRGDTKLYNVVTPERTYLNVNFSRISIDRSREDGAGLITVEMHLREIRQNAKATFSNTKDTASASTQSNGSVQASTASDSVAQVVDEKQLSAAATAPLSTAIPSIAASSSKGFFDKATQSLKTIPLVAGIASQSVAVNLGSQAVSMTLSQKRTGLFADISLNGVTAAAGVLCRDAAPLINGAFPGFPGDLAFVDMHGASDPDFSSLGDRFQMVWAG